MNKDIEATETGDFEVVDMHHNEEECGRVLIESIGKDVQVIFVVGIYKFNIGPRYATVEEARWMQDRFSTALLNFTTKVTGIDTTRVNG